MSKITIAALATLVTVLASPLAALAEQGSGEAAGYALSWQAQRGSAYASANAPAHRAANQDDFQLQGR